MKYFELPFAICTFSQYINFPHLQQHDSSIVVYLEALGLWDGKIPEFCATLMFELHEMDDGEFYIRILYRNESQTDSEAQVVTIKGREIRIYEKRPI